MPLSRGMHAAAKARTFGAKVTEKIFVSTVEMPNSSGGARVAVVDGCRRLSGLAVAVHGHSGLGAVDRPC